jgi:peroxiredoxin
MRLTTLLLTLLAPLVALAEAQIGQPAPDFTLQTVAGATVKLADLKGKPVVLEFFNPGCPYVAKFYKPGAMQASQAKAAELGATWILVSVNGKAEALAKTAADWKIAAPIGLDNGTVGKAYGAKTTPHCFVIDAAGNLAYKGAIDSIPSTKSDDIAKAENHVLAALADLKAGRPVAKPTSKPYGCGVKY